MKTRRVGTITLGSVLILFGGLYLSHLFIPAMSYIWIVKLWPLILISIGIEVLYSYFTNKEEQLRYDTAAIWILILLSAYALAMGFLDFIIRHTDCSYLY